MGGIPHPEGLCSFLQMQGLRGAGCVASFITRIVVGMRKNATTTRRKWPKKHRPNRNKLRNLPHRRHSSHFFIHRNHGRRNSGHAVTLDQTSTALRIRPGDTQRCGLFDGSRGAIEQAGKFVRFRKANQCRNRNSLELIRTQPMSSTAMRRSLASLMCLAAASTSCGEGSRLRAAR